MLKEIDLTELKNIETEILLFFHNFCEENHLIYAIGYGTLIGAIRHKGFIPWDDDIDVIMPRKDYERFLQLFNKTDKYQVVTPYNWTGYPYPFAKLYAKYTKLYEENENIKDPYGVYVDIFPIDFISEDEWLTKKIFRKKNRYRKLLSYRCLSLNNSWSTKKKLIFYVSKFFLNQFNPNQIAIKIDKLCRNEAVTGNNEKCMNLVWQQKNEIPYSTDLYKKRILVEFEGKKFYAPESYDHWLRIMYGDYMCLPPMEEQKTHHYFKAYDLR